jgi:hypothetical protein
MPRKKERKSKRPKGKKPKPEPKKKPKPKRARHHAPVQELNNMAEELKEFYDGDLDSGNSSGNLRESGQSFTPQENYVLTKVSFRVYKDIGANDVICKLYATVAGLPDGDPLDSAIINSAGWTGDTAGTATWEDWVFTGEVELQTGVKYAIVMTALGSTNYGDARTVFDTSGDPDDYPRGVALQFSAVWEEKTDRNANFKTFGTAGGGGGGGGGGPMLSGDESAFESWGF